MKKIFAFWLVLLAKTALAQQAHPNIIFIYTDDQRFDALSLVQEAQAAKARFPWFKTPNIDRIGREGARFTNSFVINSLCSPSRSTFLTSQYNHQNGIANNHTEFHSTDPMYSTELQKAGYTTGFFGKWHMSNQRGPRPGFTYSFSFFGQGRYKDCPFQLNGDQIVETHGWVDDISTDSALAFIQRNQEHPFMLALAFKSSHGPWDPPARLADAYADVKLTPSETEGSDVPYKNKVYGRNRVPANGRRDEGRNPANGSRNGFDSSGRPLTWTEKNDKMIRNYFRVLKGVDENVGRVLAYLDSAHLTDNTVVIFSTNNGYFLGEHNLGDKRAAYEESLRTPLLVRYPPRFPKGKVIDKIVLNLDIAPTILDLAGIKAPSTFQGHSWAPLVEGKPVSWRTSFLYEYFYENNYNTPTIVALRTEKAKLVKYPGEEGWSELFDLTKDKSERHNLYNEPAAAKLKAQLTAEFKRQEKLVHFRIPSYADTAAVDASGHYINPEQSTLIQEKVN
ncbi:MAG: sulfatase [Ilumatobacteraceae bacterium]